MLGDRSVSCVCYFGHSYGLLSQWFAVAAGGSGAWVGRGQCAGCEAVEYESRSAGDTEYNGDRGNTLVSGIAAV